MATKDILKIKDIHGHDQTIYGYNFGPFFVDHRFGKRWIITHTTSGMNVNLLASSTLRQAKARINELSAMDVDWDADLETLQSGDAGMEWREVTEAVRSIQQQTRAA